MAKTIQYKIDFNTSKAEDELDGIDKQLDDIQEKSKIDLLIETSESVKSVGDVRKAYKDLRDAQIEVGEGTEEFTRLGLAAGGLKDKLDSVNEVAKDLGGSTFEKFRNSIGRIKEGIVNLDLDKVKQGFSGLRTTFGGLTAGISTARLAVIGFTTALVASGIGAFVVVVGLLLSQFEDLSKAGGLIGRVFSGIANTFDGIKKTVLDLADAWGLVDKNQSKAAISAREAAKEQAKLAAEKLKAADEQAVQDIKNRNLIETELIDDARALFIAEQRNKKVEKLSEYADKLLEQLTNKTIDDKEFELKIKQLDLKLSKELLESIKKFDQDAAKARLDAQKAAEAARQAATKAFYDAAVKDLEDNNGNLINQEKQNYLNQNYSLEEHTKNLEGINTKYLEQKLVLEAQFGKDTIKIEEEILDKKIDVKNKEVEADKKKQDELTKQRKKDEDDAIANTDKISQKIDQFDKSETDKALLQIQLFDSKIAQLESQNIREGELYEHLVDKKLEAEFRLRDAVLATEEEKKAARMEAIQTGLSAASNFTNALTSLSDSIFANELANAKGNAVEEEKIRRKAFESNKKLGIVNAVISTAQAVISGFNAGASMGPAGVVMGPVMAALAGVTGAIQIATIANSQYTPTGGGVTPSTTSVPSPSVPSATTPNISFAGEGTQGLNQVGGGANQFMNVNASISVSEINNTQSTVAVYETGSIIGGG